MAKMGSRKHLKRYKAPKSWPIHPKEDFRRFSFH